MHIYCTMLAKGESLIDVQDDDAVEVLDVERVP
jgi:hypothetical protein